MKRSLKLFAMLIMSGALILLASCNGNEHKQTAADITPPPTLETADTTYGATAIPAETKTQDAEPSPAPETELPTPERTSPIEARPENVTIEWLAGELKRRQYASCIALEMLDFSDIMDRNENTDLFFYMVQLGIDRIKLDLEDNYISATNDGSLIERIVSESETEIIAEVSVGTRILSVNPQMYGDFIGEGFQIIVDKQRMVIIAYDEPNICDSIYYNLLKPSALRYRNQGMTWVDADKRAYEDIYASFVTFATEHPRQTP